MEIRTKQEQRMTILENEKLTPEEKAHLQKYVNQNIPKWCSWNINRWLSLFFSAVLIGLSVLTFSLRQQWQNIPDILLEKQLQLLNNGKISMATLDSLKSYLLTKTLFVSQFTMGFILDFVKLFMGLHLLAFSLANWNRQKHENVMKKLYRRLLRENSSEGETAAR
jgi:hypothetical protein